MGARQAGALDIAGPVQAEVLALWLSGAGIELTGSCAAAPWYIQVGARDDPLRLTAAMVRKHLGRPLVVHSTSWRQARGSVLLTFLAVLADKPSGARDSVPVRRVQLARSSATGPPRTVAVAQVIEHGLRHLAWLVRDDPVVAARLAGRWTSALRGYRPEPFQAMAEEGAAAWS
jgi:hypothetical protein